MQNLLCTVDFDQGDLKDWAIIDSGITGHFVVTAAPVADLVGKVLFSPRGFAPSSTIVTNLTYIAPLVKQCESEDFKWLFIRLSIYH